MKIVSPFRPFQAESAAHQNLGPFDWLDALEMLRASGRQYGRAEVFAITDVDTALPLPAHQYATTHRRLMLWVLEVAKCYLESDAFDQDTVMLSPDVLVFGDLRPFFKADLGVVVRTAPKFSARPLLNAAQWWKHEAKDRLIAFYRDVLARAERMPDEAIRWGADTEPLLDLLGPLGEGVMHRAGLSVCGIDQWRVMQPLTHGDERRLLIGEPVNWPSLPLVDFRYRRKHWMRPYFNATIGSAVPA